MSCHISTTLAMNNILDPFPHPRTPHAIPLGIFSSRVSRGIAVALLVLGIVGCGDRDRVQVKLQSRPLPQEPLNYLRIEAQVAGPVDDLRYKWFAGSGGCEPQESEQPKTIFKFLEG